MGTCEDLWVFSNLKEPQHATPESLREYPTCTQRTGIIWFDQFWSSTGRKIGSGNLWVSGGNDHFSNLKRNRSTLESPVEMINFRLKTISQNIHLGLILKASKRIFLARYILHTFQSSIHLWGSLLNAMKHICRVLEYFEALLKNRQVRIGIPRKLLRQMPFLQIQREYQI